MHRTSILVAAALCLICRQAQAQAQERDFSKDEIKSEKLAEGVYVLFGVGGNIGVSAGEDGVVLIDDQYAPLSDKIRAAVAGLSTEPIRFVLNTHWHGDHTGGNENLGGQGALILAHENVRVRLSTDQFIAAFKKAVPASPAAALPVVTYTDAVTMHWNGEEIHAFHVPPAHTDGDSIVVLRKSNVIHAGDLFFNGSYPFYDVSSGGSLDGIVAGLDRVLALAGPATKIIPGHGPVGGKTELQASRDMLAAVRDRIRALLLAGKSEDEILAAKPLQDLDAEWGDGHMSAEDFVRIVYSDLSRQGGK